MLKQIQACSPGLSIAERKVADWVLSHPRQAAESTLAEVSQRTGVSEPTVVRFCRSVGLGGFRELSRRLTEALSQPLAYLHQDVTKEDNDADVLAKVFDASIRALVDMRIQLSGQPLARAIARLGEARQIVFIGLGASGQVARDARHKFFRLGIPCSALTDTPSILQFASIAQPGDELIFLSARGQWPELAQAARQASGHGAGTISITRPGSALANDSTLLFAYEPNEDTSIFTPMTSRLAQLALIDALLVALTLSLGEPAAENLRAANSALT